MDFVIPAKAGIQSPRRGGARWGRSLAAKGRNSASVVVSWIPAFAGMSASVMLPCQFRTGLWPTPWYETFGVAKGHYI